MKFKIFTLWLALVAMAMPAASAQSGHSRPDGSSHSSRGADAGPIPELLRHRAELGLNAEQAKALREIDRKMEVQNRPFVEKLLRIRRGMHVRPGVKPSEMTAEERKEFEGRMAEARPLWEKIRENNHAAMREVGDVLNSEQKTQLKELLRKSREKNGSPRSGHRSTERD